VTPSREQADRDRAALIHYLETEGALLERLWLPLIRLADRWARRKTR
jgi:hypothetical protein